MPPRIDNDRRLEVDATVGSSVELPCKTSGIPQPRVVWQKGTRVLADQHGTTSTRLYSRVRLNREDRNITDVHSSLVLEGNVMVTFHTRCGRKKSSFYALTFILILILGLVVQANLMQCSKCILLLCNLVTFS